jgi:hypothetical protein
MSGNRYRTRRRRVVYSDSVPGGLSVLVGVGLLIGAVFGVIWAVGKLKEHAEGPTAEQKAAGAPSKPPSSARRPNPGSVTPPPSKPELDRAATQVTLAVVAKEIARLKGDLSGQSREYGRAVEANGRFNALAQGEETVPERLDPGDEILTVDDVDLRKYGPSDAAGRLFRAVDRMPTGTFLKFRVKRAGQEVPAYVILHGDTSLAGGDPSGAARIRVTNELAQDIQKEVLSLPETVLGRAERQQIEAILGKGEATPEEYALLTRRLATALGSNLDQEIEKDAMRSQLRAAEKLLPTAPVPDVAVTKDGRRIAGSVSSETEMALTMETPYGKVTIRRPDLVHLYTSKELRDEFDRRLETARKLPEAFPTLLTWTRDWHLPVHREVVAYHILLSDPNDRAARLAAGYYQGPGGKWVLGNSVAAGGKPASRKAENRAQLQPELEAMGFVFRNGRWFARTPWTGKIDNLHSAPEFRISMSGVAIIPWHEEDTPQARLFNPTGKPKDGTPPRIRFLGPTGTAGSAAIVVETPGEIFECQVKASGTVIMAKMGTLEVTITPEGGSSKPLYAIDEGGNQAFADVSAIVRGKKRFTVAARMTTTNDKYHGYTRFLACLPDSKEVFAVRAVVLQPAPDIDKTWASTPP